MANLYTWYDKGDQRRYIAVGEDSLFAKVYKVFDGFRTPVTPTLGQLIKFNAVDPDSFEGPIETTMKEIRKKYGPIRSAFKTPPERLGPQSDDEWVLI